LSSNSMNEIDRKVRWFASTSYIRYLWYYIIIWFRACEERDFYDCSCSQNVFLSSLLVALPIAPSLLPDIILEHFPPKIVFPSFYIIY
jgi:hypothetical protein